MLHPTNVLNIGIPLESPPAMSLPLFATRVPAGFPSPADDYIAERLDLNDLLIEHPSATFFFRVQGHSLTGIGIHNGDYLSVDRSVEAVSGDVVVAAVDSDFTVKVLVVDRAEVRLEARNPDYSDIKILNPDLLVIWGVVTGVIRKTTRVRLGRRQ